MKYSIVIVTYKARFETWLKPLIAEIKRQRPEVEIILCVNGEKDSFDEVYRKSVLECAKVYSNIYPIFYPRFRSLSRLWNLGVQAASYDKILVLSDDLTLEDGFFDSYEETLKTITTFSINISFSAFSINKYELIDVNWFDERLLGIGWEDGDFIKRYKAYYNLDEFPSVNIEWCKNVVNPVFFKVHNEKLANYINAERPGDRINGQRRDTRYGRYSEFNRLVNLDNAKIQYPYERFYLENAENL